MNLPLFENSERGIIYFVMGVNVRICYSLSKNPPPSSFCDVMI